MIGISDIEAARERITPYVRRTPVMEALLARDQIGRASCRERV